MFSNTRLTSLALAFGAIIALSSSAAYAVDANAQSRASSDPYTVNMYLEGAVQADLSTPYTNSTTSYTDITGASVSVPVWNGGISGGTDQTQGFFACYTVDGSKATSTNGTVALYVNGAVDTDTVQTGTFAAGHASLGGCWYVANTLATAQTIKLQAKSGDTAAFTVNQAALTVFRVR